MYCAVYTPVVTVSLQIMFASLNCAGLTCTIHCWIKLNQVTQTRAQVFFSFLLLHFLFNTRSPLSEMESVNDLTRHETRVLLPNWVDIINQSVHPSVQHPSVPLPRGCSLHSRYPSDHLELHLRGLETQWEQLMYHRLSLTNEKKCMTVYRVKGELQFKAADRGQGYLVPECRKLKQSVADSF